MKKPVSKGEVFAEAIGVVVMLAVALLYMAATGAYIINGVGFFFLLPISVAAYFVVTKIQFLPSTSPKKRWILYGSKLAFAIMLLILSPLIGDAVARAVNG